MELMKSHVFWFVVLGIVIFVIDEQDIGHCGQVKSQTVMTSQ